MNDFTWSSRLTDMNDSFGLPRIFVTWERKLTSIQKAFWLQGRTKKKSRIRETLNLLILNKLVWKNINAPYFGQLLTSKTFIGKHIIFMFCNSPGKLSAC